MVVGSRHGRTVRGGWWEVEKCRFGRSEGGREAQGFLHTQKLINHMAYNFRIQLMKVCVSRRRGAGFGHRLRVKKNQSADWWAQLPTSSP